MKILIDIGHPAHVHLFRHFAVEMAKKGRQFLFTTRDKEVAVHLLKVYGFACQSFGKPYKKTLGKLWGLIKFDWRLWRVAREFRPDLFMSAGSFYAAHVSFLMGRPHITCEDTGNMEQVRLYLPFTEAVLTPSVFQRDLGAKQVRYPGYHELAYLHPARFVPDPGVRSLLGATEGERYVLMRFISWSASHDVGMKGFSSQEKIRMVEELARTRRVFISSEGELPEALEKYRVRIPPERMHDVLAAADLYIGEGATMASECAALGVPAIYVNPMQAGTLDDQEKYGLIFQFRTPRGVLEKALELLAAPDVRQEFQQRRQRMLAEKTDVTEFLIHFVETFPFKRGGKLS